MNIQEIIKDYENYKKGLEGDLLKIEGIRQKQKEDLFEVKKEHLQFPDKTQKETGLSIEKWENEFDEFCTLSLFPATCILPLQYIITHFEYKKGIEFLSIHNINSSINLLDTSAGDIFQIMRQLPEHLALFVLDKICSNLNLNLLDSYKEGEDSFVNAFDMLNNKSDFINEWLLVMKVIVDGQSVEQLFIYNDNEDTIEAIKFYFQGIVDDVKKLPKLELTNEFCDAFGNDLYKTDEKGMLYIDLEDKVEYYKKLLLRYLTLSPRFDSFTKKCADKTLQHPDYLEFNNELLAECKEIIKNANVDNQDGNDGAKIESSKRQTKNIPFPLPFPEHFEINKNKQNIFFKTLYNELVKRKFISSDTRLTDFQYLLGGEKPEDYNGAKIVWLYSKTQLHCFFICYYGDTAGKEYGWKVLNKMFTIEGDDHLENNPSDVKSASSKPYIDTFKSIIERAKKGQVLDYL